MFYTGKPSTDESRGFRLRFLVKHMTKEELASLLNGNIYGREISEQQAQAAKDAGLVVVFGRSDDLIEFRGAINDESGMSAFVTKTGLFGGSRYGSESGQTIKALWRKEKPYCWTYQTDIPHATFIIYEDGQPWCCGIVFSLSDL